MKNIVRIVTHLLKTICAGLVSITILSFFVLVYKYTGAHIENADGSTDFKWSSHQYIGGMVEGFNWTFVNEDGYNNLYERPENIDVLVMGSSHTEGFNVKTKETFSSVFAKNNPDISIYNIGISGHAFNASIDNMENAIKEYKPTQFIVIETSQIFFSESIVDKAINHTRKKGVSQKGIVAGMSRYVPSIKALYLKISEWRNANGVGDEEDLNDNPESHAAESFIKYASDIADEYGIKLVIIYHPKTQLDSEGCLISPKSSSWFEKECIDNDVIFVDMTEDFTKLYDEKHILAHGFINTEVGTGHLNKYGHQLIAEKLEEVLREEK